MIINIRSEERIPVGTLVRIVDKMPKNRMEAPTFTEDMKSRLGRVGTITQPLVIGHMVSYRIAIELTEEELDSEDRRDLEYEYAFRPEWFEVLTPEKA